MSRLRILWGKNYQPLMKKKMKRRRFLCFHVRKMVVIAHYCQLGNSENGHSRTTSS